MADENLTPISEKEEDILEYYKSRTNSFYSEKEFLEKYNIESIAFGGCLCTDKKSGSMNVFLSVEIGGNKYFYK